MREEELKEQASLPLMRHPREDQLEELSRRQAEREFADSCAHTDRQTVLVRSRPCDGASVLKSVHGTSVATLGSSTGDAPGLSLHQG